jgi:dienelactone hydrolase
MPQTLQGADRLSASLDTIVLMPDLLKGSYAQAEWFGGKPLGGEAKKASEAFMSWMAFANHVEPLLEIVKGAKERYPGVEAWGVFGLCWGGKVCFRL